MRGKDDIFDVVRATRTILCGKLFVLEAGARGKVFLLIHHCVVPLPRWGRYFLGEHVVLVVERERLGETNVSLRIRCIRYLFSGVSEYVRRHMRNHD